MKRLTIKKGYKRDPVCEMLVPEQQHAAEYNGMHFAFCSLQCRERFMDTPHLYIGNAGHKAPKQEGIEAVKKRTIRLDQPLSSDQITAIHSAINEMMGIKEVQVTADVIRLRYDLIEVTFAQLESVIVKNGGLLRQRWPDRFWRSCIRFFEKNESRSMSVGAGSGKSCH